MPPAHIGDNAPMRLRKPLWFAAAAMLVAAAVCYFAYPASYAEQLVRIQARQEFGRVDPRILDEPLEIQAVLLDYAPDRVLALKAWIALLRYPRPARELLLAYGSTPEFRQILAEHGEAVIPVIQYFREHDVWSVSAMDAAARAGNRLKEWAGALASELPGRGHAAPATPEAVTTREPEAAAAKEPAAARSATLGPDERGWYAINFIGQEGHDLLAQFTVTPNGEVKWNQTDRLVKALTSFLTSGVRTLESRHDLGEQITTSDLFWAGLDVAMVAVPFKLLRAGKAVARSGEELSVMSRTRLFAPRWVARGSWFQSLGKYGAVAATIYIVASHPSLLSSLFGEAARMMGLSPWLVQFAGWTLVILLLLYPVSWLLRPVARGTLHGLAWLNHSHRRNAARDSLTRRADRRAAAD